MKLSSRPRVEDVTTLRRGTNRQAREIVENRFFATAFIATCLIGAPAAAEDAPKASVPAIGWSRAAFVIEVNGEIAGAWAASIVSACRTKPAITYVETASLTRLQIAGKCRDGEEVFLYTRRTGPAPATDGACSFDYVTIGGLIPSVFDEVTEKSAGPKTMAELRKALPNLRHAFATKQGGGYVALIGWTELPLESTAAQTETALVQSAAQRQKTAAEGDYSYSVEREFPISIVSTNNYADGGKKLRDYAMDVVASQKCMFSIKLTGDRHAGDDGNGRAIQGEFARIRRVIRDHEHGLPTAVSGVR